MATITLPSRRSNQRRFARVAGSALLALTVGIAGWQLATQGQSANRVSVPVSDQPAALGHVSDQEQYQRWQLNAGTAAHRASVPSGGSAAPAIYLVRSAEQAEAVRAALDQRDEILTQQGQPLPPAELVVVGSEDEAITVHTSIEEANSVRAGLSLPPVSVIDLRGN
jgi:hypothetical protein